jgi:hypothetical protein
VKSVCLVILEDFNPSEIIQKLRDFDFSNLRVSIFALNHQNEMEEQKGKWEHDERIDYHIFPFPEDEFFFKDLVQHIKGEEICFFNPSYDYPTDYFQRILNKDTEEQDEKPVKRKGSLTKRVLRAAQQSKYGMGVLKKNIKRDFSELQLSNIYSKSTLSSAHILEQSVDEELPEVIYNWAEKNKIERGVYHPNYKKIEYFETVDSYVSGVKKEAPYLKFKEHEDASGLPLYLLIMLWLSFIAAFIFPAGILVFLVFLAIYALVISLEALAISTLKRQGEIFIGLLFFFPFLHHVYLFTYFSSLLWGKK